MKTVKNGETSSHEDIWKLIRETTKLQKEAQKLFKETDKQFKETDKQFKETDKQFKETDKQFKETDKKFDRLEGFFSSQWGKFMESLVEGDLVKLLRERNINVERTSSSNKFPYQGREYEYDILAVNKSEIVVVEVKTSLRVEDVKRFLENLSLFREVFKEYKDYRVYGAVAYLKVFENADKFAYRNGLFVIKATGNSAVITNSKEFEPGLF
ncbi:MAG: hypothetical protein NTU44_19910 [Bacteroidetes bacterium]|nr:hypothetical protein [Bacteroidota bacterium]